MDIFRSGIRNTGTADKAGSDTPALWIWLRLRSPVLWNRNYLLRFRYRFWLLESYGSGSGSDFWKVMVPVPTFEKVTVQVPVPVPAPYLDNKKQIVLKKGWNFFDFILSKLFYKEKVHKFQQIYSKKWMKKCLPVMKEIKYIILCLVPVPEP